MSAQVCSVPGQTEGRGKAFLEWKSIDLSYKLLHLLQLWVMLTIIKVFINLFLPVRIGNNLAIFKMNQLSMSSAILCYKMKLLFFSL